MGLERKTKKDSQEDIFGDIPPDWSEEWWDMPEFSMGDAMPTRRLTVNFLTTEDFCDFKNRLGLQLSPKADSVWWPQQERLRSCEYIYSGEKTGSRFPVCIPSKGRHDTQTTGRVLEEMGVDHLFFIEETEADKYKTALGERRVVVLPFHDLGQGSIPARNYIWEWAKERGFKRHWTVDDNIMHFQRLNLNRRLCVKGGGFFRAMEDFVDRYENIAMAGPHHRGFAPDRVENVAPYFLNSRVYSCILLDTTLPHRWRGRYNEDTDLSLRLLKDGFCTLLFRALLMGKGSTAVGDGSGNGSQGKAMMGGNTDTVYNAGDYRLRFAQSLAEQHPDCVRVVWKFGRWHHEVDYSRFARNKPILKPGVIKLPRINNYGMEIVQVKKDG